MKQLCVLFTRFFIEVITFGVLTLLFTKIAYGQVVINEVMPAPSTGNEWVEVKNTSETAITLSGWKLEDAAGALSPTPPFQSSIVPAHGLTVFELVNKLNNTGDSVILKNPTQQIVDQLRYSSSSATLSWSRNSSGQFALSTPSRGLENFIAHSSPSPSPSVQPTSPTPVVSPSPSTAPTPTITPSPSPAVSPFPISSASPTPLATPTSTPTPAPSATPLVPITPVPVPSPTPAAVLQPIQVSEVVACPATGESEWIEFYNPNSTTVELQNWRVKDATGNSRVLTLSVPAKKFTLFELSTGILNNDGDSLTFFNQEGKQLLSLNLPACEQEQSTVFTTQGWRQTTTVTAFTENVLTSVDQINTSPSPLTLAERSTDESVLNTFDHSYFSNLSQATSELVSTHDAAQSEMLQSAVDELETAATPEVPVLLPSSPLPLAAQPEAGGIKNVEVEQVKQTTPLMSKAMLSIILFFSLGCLAIGGYGVYKWYTDRRVEAALQVL